MIVSYPLSWPPRAHPFSLLTSCVGSINQSGRRTDVAGISKSAMKVLQSIFSKDNSLNAIVKLSALVCSISSLCLEAIPSTKMGAFERIRKNVGSSIVILMYQLGAKKVTDSPRLCWLDERYSEHVQGQNFQVRPSR